MRSFDAALRTALEFISNPHKIWESGRLCDRRAVLRLAFPGGFQYHRNTGLRTAGTPLPFKVLGAIASKKIQLAEIEDETSNHILEVLEEWNDYLKNNASYYQEPSP